jgi:hypothetical protein
MISHREKFIKIGDHLETLKGKGIKGEYFWYLEDAEEGIWRRVGKKDEIPFVGDNGDAAIHLIFKYEHILTPFDLN